MEDVVHAIALQLDLFASQLNVKDAQIAAKDEQLKEKDKQLAAKDEQLLKAARDAAKSNNEEEREKQIEANAEQLREKDKQIAAKDEQIREKDKQIAARDEQIFFLLSQLQHQSQQPQQPQQPTLGTIIEENGGVEEGGKTKEHREIERLRNAVRLMTEDIKKEKEQRVTIEARLAAASNNTTSHNTKLAETPAPETLPNNEGKTKQVQRTTHMEDKPKQAKPLFPTPPALPPPPTREKRLTPPPMRTGIIAEAAMEDTTPTTTTTTTAATTEDSRANNEWNVGGWMTRITEKTKDKAATLSAPSSPFSSLSHSGSFSFRNFKPGGGRTDREMSGDGSKEWPASSPSSSKGGSFPSSPISRKQLRRGKSTEEMPINASLIALTASSVVSMTANSLAESFGSLADSPGSSSTTTPGSETGGLLALITKGAQLATIKATLSASPQEITTRDEMGRTPLHLAVNRKPPRPDLVEHVLSFTYSTATQKPFKAEVNATDSEGCTPLHFACQVKSCINGDVIKILLQGGANPSIANQDGWQPLHFLVQSSPHFKDLMPFQSTLDDLLNAGADINARTQDGDTPLHCCVAVSDAIALPLLADRKPDFLVSNNRGDTLLHTAVLVQSQKMVEMLLHLGLDPRGNNLESATNPPSGTSQAGSSNMSALALAESMGIKGRIIYNILRGRVSSMALKAITDLKEKDEYRRRLLIEEICITEREFLEDLEVLVKVYLKPIEENLKEDTQSTKILTQEQFDALFGNIEEIREVSQSLFSDLQEGCNGKDLHIGKIFLAHMAELKKYEKVCVEQQRSTECLQITLNKKPAALAASKKQSKRDQRLSTEFAKFCATAETTDECRRLDISDFLIKPFQRVTKYPLLLNNLLKHTQSDYPDYKDLVEAEIQMKFIVSNANELKRASDKAKKIAEISDKITWPSAEIMQRVMRGTEKDYVDDALFLHVVANKEKKAKRHVFLLSDVMIFTHTKDRKTYQYLYDISLDSCTLKDLPDEEGDAVLSFVTAVPKNGFQVSHTTRDLRVAIYAKDPQEKTKWMNTITEYTARLNPNGPNKTTTVTTTSADSSTPSSYDGIPVSKEEGGGSRPSSTELNPADLDSYGTDDTEGGEGGHRRKSSWRTASILSKQDAAQDARRPGALFTSRPTQTKPRSETLPSIRTPPSAPLPLPTAICDPPPFCEETEGSVAPVAEVAEDGTPTPTATPSSPLPEPCTLSSPPSTPEPGTPPPSRPPVPANPKPILRRHSHQLTRQNVRKETNNNPTIEEGEDGGGEEVAAEND